jgi:hypothetical protein
VLGDIHPGIFYAPPTGKRFRFVASEYTFFHANDIYPHDCQAATESMPPVS